MTTYPVDEVLGMGTKTIALLNSLKPAMIAKAVDPTAVITSLTAQGPVLSTRNAVQDKMQKDIAPVTVEVNGLKDTHYTDSSAALDLVIGTFGKRSSEAKQAQDIRKGLTKTKKRGNGGSTPTPPTP
ncbi:MAG: hypothetical protein HY301_16295 [Verrucomicrobia bacterium]|nr:hypothetical protein [Verrucomicrobiota bacterium]